MRCQVIQPDESRESLGTIVSEFCQDFEGGNTTVTSTYVKSKKKFLIENFPEIQSGKGCHTHPDLFIGHTTKRHGFYDSREDKHHLGNQKGDEYENAAFNFITEQLAKENCFIYHGYGSGIDKDIVEQYTSRLKDLLNKPELTTDQAKAKQI